MTDTSSSPMASLRWRMRVVFLVALVVALVSIVLGAVSFASLLDARRQLIDRVDPALASTERLLAAMVDQETGLRAYVLSDGDETFLEPWQRGVAEQERAQEHLADILSEVQVMGDPLDGLDASITRWQEDYAAPTLDEVQAGEPGAASDAALGEGRALFDDIRGRIAALQRELVAERDAARSELDQATTRVVVTLLVAATALLGTVGALWWLATRSIERPLEGLRADAAAVAGGDFSHAVELQGLTEMQELADAMERMRLRILADLGAAEAARDELGARSEELAARSEELDRVNADLARSNAELEQFAYVASHDLQEPLRKVASFCQLLQTRYGGQLDERADQYIDFAVDGAKRMQALINDLLAFSRVGRLDTGQVDEIPLDDAVGRALENLTMVTEDTGAQIELPRWALPTVRGELGLLTALFQNLIGNAIKFRRPDVTPFVRVTASSTDEAHEITIEDNGIGIEPEYADRIFVIFQRLHPKDRYEGTGIGLALCRKIVEHHGGTIAIDTAPRDEPGTTFRITLPTSERSPL